MEDSVLVILTTLLLSVHFRAWTAVAEEGKKHGMRMFAIMCQILNSVCWIYGSVPRLRLRSFALHIHRPTTETVVGVAFG